MEFEHGNINALDQNEMLRTLEQGKVGHLGCFSKNEVYVVPITYVFENPYIFSHSRDGKKIALMRKNPRVCVEVEEVHNVFEWKSVIAWGKFEELQDEFASRAMRLLIKKIVGSNKDLKMSPLAIDFAAMLESAVIYSIHVEKITGRFEGNFKALHQ
jgi:hypothetical protein